ncbi:MAG: hypothetical protein GY754_01740 [bacterium]|nr:hypothetical protein [bacterium]
MKRFHGVFSLFLVFVANGVGVAAIFPFSRTLALVYGAVVPLAWLLIIFFFCAKCPCRDHGCGHILPGKLTKIFPPRKQGKYSPLDFGATGIALALLVGIPQYWLWQNTVFFIAFWAINTIALLEIRLLVCKECSNEFCPGFPNKPA